MPTTEGEQETSAPDDAAPPEDPVENDSMSLETLELEHLVDSVLSEREVVGPPVPDPYVGLEIDRRYVIESLIAAGGMGLVYRCRHRVLGKKLAIKIIRADVAQMPDGSERFLLEAKAASAIGHEHIVDIGDFGALPDGSPYLVMEYLEGVSLSALLREEPCLGVPRIAHLAIQIAEGLGAAHAAGIVHRDLKPDNVFVLERKGEDFIKILDFGVARMAQSAKRLTQAGTIVGTPHYMSPEQALGLEVDHRGDIYALGVILYELLAGRVPFDGDHYLSVLHQHLQALPPAFSELEPPVSIPAAIEHIVNRCLAKSPAERFANMAELARELGPFRELARLGELEELAMGEEGGALEPRDALDPRLWPPSSGLARRHASERPAPRAGGGVSGRVARQSSGPPRPVAPLPTAVLPAPSPTRVMPRLTGSFSAPEKRVVTGLSVVVLVVVCAVAAFRLGSTRGSGIEAPPPERAPLPGVASSAPAVKTEPTRASSVPASDAAVANPTAANPAGPNPPPAGTAPSGAASSGSPGASTPEPPPANSALEEPATSAPGAAAEPGSERPSTATPGANPAPRGNGRPRRAPAQPSTSKRPDGSRPAPKPPLEGEFMNPWPAPR